MARFPLSTIATAEARLASAARASRGAVGANHPFSETSDPYSKETSKC
jgi:hypothetical protein